MEKKALTEKAKLHLQLLCAEIGERRVGSEENRRATAYAEKVLKVLEWETDTTELSVIDWHTDGATLNCNGQGFEVLSSHYSLGCSVTGELVAINKVKQLETKNIKDRIVLLLAELLKDFFGDHPIELVVLNGEDYYGAPGQIRYIEQNEGRFSDILLNINIDGAGYKEGISCFSPFGLPEDMLDKLHEVLWDAPELVEGLPWYQGDHSIFLQQGCPAIAVSSEWFIEHMETQEITHTPKDNLEVVNYERVAECVQGIAAFLQKLEE